VRVINSAKQEESGEKEELRKKYALYKQKYVEEQAENQRL
jgi:hypothetical protein